MAVDKDTGVVKNKNYFKKNLSGRVDTDTVGPEVRWKLIVTALEVGWLSPWC